MRSTTAATTIFGLPLLLSCVAGGSTCLGAAVVFGCQTVSSSQLAFALSLAGSVMMTVSFYSILPECFRVETDEEDEESSMSSQYLSINSFLFWQRCFGLALGAFSYFCLARCAFPEPNEIMFRSEHDECGENELELFNNNQQEQDIKVRRSLSQEEEFLLSTKVTARTPQQRLTFSLQRRSSSLEDTISYNKQSKPTSFWHGTDLNNAHAQRAWRVALLLFLSLLVHNFPEGLAVAASTLHSPQLGITTTIAIALHNIPEGIAVAVTCLAARPNAPWMAFVLASASGLAEPAGALCANYIPKPGKM
ncbi:hypothetical protein FisN_3Lh580 [Fistulifera solaris]|uniref:Solute carrier family 39 (Zinc transporter), member 1/2/3 n=1 Tax=Fistulifera solaris TaxID=1519565 RepID=A0A1Z5J987_FISSO|nr:hypothetical protein FisN_3Lh580 [Fistulifera solaris]|eukprot:GAX10368.1 hypothetical protein FisN_3Lh580 [Fistulifera solaris]